MSRMIRLHDGGDPSNKLELAARKKSPRQVSRSAWCSATRRARSRVCRCRSPYRLVRSATAAMGRNEPQWHGQYVQSVDVQEIDGKCAWQPRDNHERAADVWMAHGQHSAGTCDDVPGPGRPDQRRPAHRRARRHRHRAPRRSRYLRRRHSQGCPARTPALSTEGGAGLPMAPKARSPEPPAPSRSHRLPRHQPAVPRPAAPAKAEDRRPARRRRIHGAVPSGHWAGPMPFPESSGVHTHDNGKTPPAVLSWLAACAARR
jgi:hypothetical protein